MAEQEISIPLLSKQCNEALILATLAQEKKHGYQLALEIEERSQGLFKFNHGTLYPILHKLEKEGLIKGTWKEEGPKRKRKYYTLTAKGRRHLTGQKQAWSTFFHRLFDILGEEAS